MKISPFFSLTAIMFLLTLAGCAGPRVFVDDNLKNNATEYVVENRQNAFKSTLRFGSFEFTNIKRGWTTTASSKPAIFKTQNEAKNKMSFKIKHNRLESDIFCASQAMKKDINFGGIQMSDDSKDVFTGRVQINNATSWDFIVKNPNNLNWDDPSNGYATNGDKRIEIQDVRKAAGTTPKFMPSTILGYSFVFDKTPIAVVETAAGKGGVWIKKGLDPEVEFIVANLAAALLLRTDLSSDLHWGNQ